MKIENLSTGMVIKNYKELCEVLEVEVKDSTNSKKAQLKELERHCRFHKEGQKFVIDEIYEEVKDKMDKRNIGNNRSEYISIIEKLILDLMLQNYYKEEVVLSKNQLLKTLKMINGNYSFCKTRVQKLAQYIDTPKDTIEEWYASTNTTLQSNIETALNSLRKQSLIFWSNEISICKIDVNKHNDIFDIQKSVKVDEYDEEISTYKINAKYDFTHRESTNEEKRFILHTEREVMKEMGFDNKQLIVQCGMWSQFQKKIYAITLKEMNIEYYYNSYKIIFNKDHVIEKYEELMDDLLLSKEDREFNQNELNKAIQERLNVNVGKRHTKAIEETKNIFGKICDEKLERRIDDNYILDNDKLIYNLIDLKSKNIKKSVKRIKIDH